MNNTPDINKLFEAARRREADIRRQQQLSDMIDRMAENEEPKSVPPCIPAKSRRRLWPYFSAAASVLLFSAIGLHILSHDITTPSRQSLIAETKPQLPAIVESSDSTVETGNDAVVPMRKQHTSAVLAINETTDEPTSLKSQQNKQEGDKTIIEMPVVLPDEPLLAEESATATNTDEDAESSQKSSSPVVYERTSTRLVCGSGCRPEVRHNQEDTPNFAFTNISRTGTTIGIGNGGF